MGVVNHAIETAALSLTGIDLDSSTEMSGGFTFLEGGPFPGPDDVIIDQLLCRPARASKLGDTIKLLSIALARLRHHRGRQTGAHRAVRSKTCRT